MSSLRETYLEIFDSINFEKIIDHPNILIAASFWETDRYEAAKTCYRFMRIIDDLVDNHKSMNKITGDEEKEKLTGDVTGWLNLILNGGPNDPFQKELKAAILKFRIPVWPLEAFAKSMIYDICHDGFETLQTFISYAGGASVAPAAIFVHLAGLKHSNGAYSEPDFNVREAAQACAIFSYLVHIMRDFQKDQLNNLNYFADDIISKYNLTRSMLSDISRGGTIPAGFRQMMEEYYKLAARYRDMTFDCIRSIWNHLEPRYQLSLEVIFELYLMVYERINIKSGNFTSVELNPTANESRERVYRTIINSKTL